MPRGRPSVALIFVAAEVTGRSRVALVGVQGVDWDGANIANTEGTKVNPTCISVSRRVGQVSPYLKYKRWSKSLWCWFAWRYHENDDHN